MALKKTLIGLCVAAALTGCNIETPMGDGDPSAQTTLSGVASKGHLKYASITAYQVLDGRLTDTVLATTSTNENGEYSLDLGDYKGAVKLVARGSQMLCDAPSGCDADENGVIDADEAFGHTVNLSAPLEMSAVLYAEQDNVTAQITPLTTIAADLAEAGNILDRTAIDASNSQISNLFDINRPLLQLKPVDLTQDIADQDDRAILYAMFNAAVAEMAQQQDMTISGMLRQLSQNIVVEDGQLSEADSDKLLAAMTSVFDSVYEPIVSPVDPIDDGGDDPVDPPVDPIDDGGDDPVDPPVDPIDDGGDDPVDPPVDPIDDGGDDPVDPPAEPGDDAGKPDLEKVKSFVADVRDWGHIISQEAKPDAENLVSDLEQIGELVEDDFYAMADATAILLEFIFESLDVETLELHLQDVLNGNLVQYSETLDLSQADLMAIYDLTEEELAEWWYLSVEDLKNATGTVQVDLVNNSADETSLLFTVSDAVIGQNRFNLSLSSDMTIIQSHSVASDLALQISGSIENDSLELAAENGVINAKAIIGSGHDDDDVSLTGFSASLESMTLAEKHSLDPFTFTGNGSFDTFRVDGLEDSFDGIGVLPKNIMLSGRFGDTERFIEADFKGYIDNADSYVLPEQLQEGTVIPDLVTYNVRSDLQWLAIEGPGRELVFEQDNACFGGYSFTEYEYGYGYGYNYSWSGCVDRPYNKELTSAVEAANYHYAQRASWGNEHEWFWDSTADYIVDYSDLVFTEDGGVIPGIVEWTSPVLEDEMNFLDVRFELAVEADIGKPQASLMLKADRSGLESGEFDLSLAYRGETGTRMLDAEFAIEDGELGAGSAITLTNIEGVVLTLNPEQGDDGEWTGSIVMDQTKFGTIFEGDTGPMIRYTDGSLESLY